MKNRFSKYRASLCLTVAASALWAHQASPVDVSVESILSRHGDSFLRLTNNTRESQTLTFSPGPAGTANFRPTREIVLSPNARLEANLGDLQLENGIQVFHVVSTVSLRGGGTVPGPELHEVVEVDPTGISRTTYERAFLSQRIAIGDDSIPARVEIGGGYIDAQPMARLAFESAAVSDDTPFERIDEVSTYELSRMERKQLPRDAGGAEGEGAFPQRMRLERFQTARGEDGTQQRQVGPFGTIKGKFLVKLPGAGGGPAVFQAAWGWKIKIWQMFAGQKANQVGQATVAGDGTWSADYFFPPLPGEKVRVEYQPANRFLQIQDANGNIYTWHDNWDVTTGTTNIGGRSADLTKTGNAPGIDRLYQGGMALWRKFNKHGMNALRDEPIQITYPNTLASGNCTRGTGSAMIAWSCSKSASGKIWMIAEHATARVIQHELAHSIHSFYWDGDMPAGGGIDHDIDKCYNPGLALTEGFADFMPFWVQFDRTNPAPVLGFNIETLGPGFCTGQNGEARVAATFWDAYDSVNDGSGSKKDTWNYFHPYAPVSTFLNNPDHASMIEYLNVYTIILGNNMFTPIAQMFQLNTIF
jgi:hypothetical protein